MIFTFLLIAGILTSSDSIRDTTSSPDSITTASINFSGMVTKVVDGDTLDVLTSSDEKITIRLALIDAPERDEAGYNEAKIFTTDQCLNKNAEVDPDNNQGLTYGRTVGVVYCEGVNVNDAILDSNLADIYENYCDISEFADTNWAQEHGCSSNNNDDNNDNDVHTNQKGERVDSSSNDDNQADIMDTSRDLDCKDFDKKNIPVGSEDPYNLDSDGDGIGCEG
jgi:micrococcal nuclease